MSRIKICYSKVLLIFQLISSINCNFHLTAFQIPFRFNQKNWFK